MQQKYWHVGAVGGIIVTNTATRRRSYQTEKNYFIKSACKSNVSIVANWRNMPQYRMGEALGLRPSFLRTLFSALTSTLPRFDPSQYGLADYSFYEGVVNFILAKVNGVKRPIIRVGQGYYGIDVQFKTSSANSKGLFSRDFYWMLDPHQSANGQALACANALKANGNLDDDSILFADFELGSTGAPYTNDASFLWGFLSTIKAQLPNLKLGIYTGYSFWETNGSIDPKYGFDQYKLWIAWPVTPYQTPKALAPWGTNWYYHQWTFNGDGKFYGAGTLGVDLNYLNPVYAPAPQPQPVASHVISIKYMDGTSDEFQAQSNLSQSLDNATEVDVDTVPFHRVVPVPPQPVYYQVLHDQNTPHVYNGQTYFLPRMLWPDSTNNPNVGIPETVNLENSNPVKLTKAWQLYIAALLRQYAAAGTDIDRAFRSLLGRSEAWANGTGYPQAGTGSPKADYVGNTDLLYPLPSLDRSRISGGNVVHVLDETPVSVGGHLCLKVETLRADTVPDPTLINHKLTPWLVFLCTTVTPFNVTTHKPSMTGPWICARFPQLAGNDVPMPLITDVGYGYIKVERLKKISSPFGVSPYVFS